jgi:hypothetical protein
VNVRIGIALGVIDITSTAIRVDLFRAYPLRLLAVVGACRKISLPKRDRAHGKDHSKTRRFQNQSDKVVFTFHSFRRARPAIVSVPGDLSFATTVSDYGSLH